MATEADVEPPIGSGDADMAVFSGVLVGMGGGIAFPVLIAPGVTGVVWGVVSGVLLLVGLGALGHTTEGYDGW